MSELKIEIENGKANIYTPYNSDFVRAIKNIGGAKWTGKCWAVPEDAADAAREIMKSVYGMDDSPNSETVKLKVTVLNEIYEDRTDVNFLGKCLCHASGRDSGGKPGTDVSYISGSPKSGGSAKNWESRVPKGSVIILSNVSKSLYDAYLENPSEYYKVEVIESKKSKEQLMAEKEELLKRISEIDKLLED